MYARLVCNESFFSPTVGERLARNFRMMAGRPTFKDRLSYMTPKNIYYSTRIKNRRINPNASLSDKFEIAKNNVKDLYNIHPNTFKTTGALGLVGLGAYTLNRKMSKESSVQEGFGDLFGHKQPSRWQRLKNLIGRNKVRIGTSALTLAGAGWIGRSRYNYNKAYTKAEKELRDQGLVYDEKRNIFHNHKKGDKTQKKVNYVRIPEWNMLKGYGDQKLSLNKGIMVAKEMYYPYNENFITDAVDGVKEKIGNAYNTVKGTVQRNVGNIANAINSGVNSAKEFAGGVADKISGLQNKVSNFASNVVGSKNVKPVINKPRIMNQNPQMSTVRPMRMRPQF